MLSKAPKISNALDKSSTKQMINQAKTIFITGAGGFIGGRLVERIFLGNIAKVRAGVKDWSEVARIARFPVEIVKCNVMDKKNLPQIIKGSDVIVHCAYGNRKVTEEGTANMLKASLQIGVKRFIHFSTVEVYGNISGRVNESTPIRYSGNEYADSKVNAEKFCREYYKKGLPVVILRPTVVYGPFCRVWTTNLAERLLSGKWRIPSNMKGFCRPVYVDDVVDAVFLSIKNKNAVGEAFNIGGPETISWNEFFENFNKAIGVPPLKKQNFFVSYIKTLLMIPIRVGAKYAMSHPELMKKTFERWPTVKRFAKKGETFIKSSMSTGELAVYNRKAIYSIEKARRILGYNPNFDLRQGLKLTVAWLKHNGYIPRKNLEGD